MALQIHDYMSPARFVFPDTTTRDETLSTLAAVSGAAVPELSVPVFEKAVLEREQIVSTGIGLGVAVPHAKLSDISSFFVTVGILKHPVGWDSIDKEPVRLVFLIGGPDNDQTTYLRILSKIVLVTKNAHLRDSLLALSDSEDAQRALELFSSM